MIERLFYDAGEKPRMGRLAANLWIIETLSSGCEHETDFKPFEALDELVFVRMEDGQVLMPKDLEGISLSKDFIVLDRKLDEIRKAFWVKKARICDLVQEDADSRRSLWNDSVNM